MIIRQAEIKSNEEKIKDLDETLTHLQTKVYALSPTVEKLDLKPYVKQRFKPLDNNNQS